MRSRGISFRRGFSIVEITIVLLIIGIAAAVAVPKYIKSLCYYRADTAAKRIVADLEWAQRRARTTSTSQAVQFTLTTNSYKLPGVPDASRPSTDYTVKLAAEPFDATLVSVNFANSTTVTFSGFARPSAAGTIVVSAGSTQKTISVDADSGKATVQ